MGVITQYPPRPALPFERLSPTAEKGIEAFRAYLRTRAKDQGMHLFKSLIQIEAFEAEAAVQDKATGDYVVCGLDTILLGFCMSAGATMFEASDAVTFARTRRFWMDDAT